MSSSIAGSSAPTSAVCSKSGSSVSLLASSTQLALRRRGDPDRDRLDAEDLRQLVRQVLAHARQLALRRQLGGQADESRAKRQSLGEEALVDHAVEPGAQRIEQQAHRQAGGEQHPERHAGLAELAREERPDAADERVEAEHQQRGQGAVEQAAAHHQLEVEEPVEEDRDEHRHRIGEQRVVPDGGRQAEAVELERRDDGVPEDDGDPGQHPEQHQAGLQPAARIGVGEGATGDDRAHRDRPDRQQPRVDELVAELGAVGGPGAAQGVEHRRHGGEAGEAQADAVEAAHHPAAALEPGRRRRQDGGQVEIEAELQPGDEHEPQLRRQADRRVGGGDRGRQRELERHRQAERHQQRGAQVVGAARRGEQAEGEIERAGDRREGEAADVHRHAGDDLEAQPAILAGDFDLDGAAAGELRRQAIEIARFVDRLAVEGEQQVALAQAGARRRAVLVDLDEADLGRRRVVGDADPPVGAIERQAQMDEQHRGDERGADQRPAHAGRAPRAPLRGQEGLRTCVSDGLSSILTRNPAGFGPRFRADRWSRRESTARSARPARRRARCRRGRPGGGSPARRTGCSSA